ncbi:integrin alpha [Nostoc flagelliforme]|uniref:integrin alpha n=1 Tax=Nostoc flagelliforme TaxID=1306274 RepID=UPI0018F0539D|nr:integrin alpha [Nostoc flagelliforme]
MVNSSFNFSNLDGTNGFAADDRSGYSVNSTGDVNNDGIADLIIGVAGTKPNDDFLGKATWCFARVQALMPLSTYSPQRR